MATFVQKIANIQSHLDVGPITYQSKLKLGVSTEQKRPDPVQIQPANLLPSSSGQIAIA